MNLSSEKHITGRRVGRIISTANLITLIRIVFSVVLLFCQAFSPLFCGLYAAAGLSDMIDGAVARRTGSADECGARLDTMADIVFVAVCLIKLLPALGVPLWLHVWIGIVAVIKVSNIAMGYIGRKSFISVHSAINRVTGALLFLFPLTLAFMELTISAVIVCAVATAAAIHEGCIIKQGLG